MGCLYQLIKTMKEHHLIDEHSQPVKDKHIPHNDSMKALSDIENDILKSPLTDGQDIHHREKASLANQEK